MKVDIYSLRFRMRSLRWLNKLCKLTLTTISERYFLPHQTMVSNPGKKENINVILYCVYCTYIYHNACFIIEV